MKNFDIKDGEVEVELKCFSLKEGGIELCSLPFNLKVSKEDNIKAEGPILDADSRDDVASDQDDVDDLLSSLGF